MSPDTDLALNLGRALFAIEEVSYVRFVLVERQFEILRFDGRRKSADRRGLERSIYGVFPIHSVIVIIAALLVLLVLRSLAFSLVLLSRTINFSCFLIIRSRRITQWGVVFGILQHWSFDGRGRMVAFGTGGILGGDALAGDERWHAEEVGQSSIIQV